MRSHGPMPPSVPPPDELVDCLLCEDVSDGDALCGVVVTGVVDDDDEAWEGAVTTPASRVGVAPPVRCRARCDFCGSARTYEGNGDMFGAGRPASVTAACSAGPRPES